MIELLYQYEPTIRLGVFLGGFILLALLELIRPKRKLTTKKISRWVNNLSLIFTGTILVKLLIPTAVISIAYLVEENNWGVTNYLEMNFLTQVIVTFVLLDLTIYFQHLLFHAVPILWRIHRVHHSDLDCDVSTGLRFHPIEILLSVTIKISVIIFFGAPVLTVIIFEVILNVMSMFTHSNIRINKKFEHILRWFITTPDMHRIHHSVIENETNSNFTFFISLWDRIFQTYLESPQKGHFKMSLGLSSCKDSRLLAYPSLMTMPFIGEIRGYAINHRDMRNAEELERINAQLSREIEEKNKQADELVLARNAAEKASSAKSRFISNISHELRTPMHGILSYSNFGIGKIGKVSNEKLLDYFENIKSCGDRLLSLIDNLLDLSKLESGSIELLKEQTRLSDIFTSCIKQLRAPLTENKISVSVKMLTNIDTIILDPKLISQVITNLLSNSMKFSPSNTIISVIISNQPLASLNISEKQNHLYISIIDEGVGIPDGELESVFSSFNQSSLTDTGAGGIGLGLAISKDIIEAHGGEIWAKNNVDSPGVTFIFSLPVLLDE